LLSSLLQETLCDFRIPMDSYELKFGDCQIKVVN